MFDFVFNLVSLTISLGIPVFASFKALYRNDVAFITYWLQYWMVYVTVSMADSLSRPILAWVPLYSLLRMLVYIWLVYPQTQGFRILYEEYMLPELSRHQDSLDRVLDRGVVMARRLHVFDCLMMLKGMVEMLTAASSMNERPAAPDTAAPTEATWWGYWSSQPFGKLSVVDKLASFNTANRSVWAKFGTARRGPAIVIPDSCKTVQEQQEFLARQREELAEIIAALDSTSIALRAQQQSGSGRKSPESLDGFEVVKRDVSRASAETSSQRRGWFF